MVSLYEEHAGAQSADIPWPDWRALPWYVKAECVAFMREQRLVEATMQDVMAEEHDREVRRARNRQGDKRG